MVTPLCDRPTVKEVLLGPISEDCGGFSARESAYYFKTELFWGPEKATNNHKAGSSLGTQLQSLGGGSRERAGAWRGPGEGGSLEREGGR